MVSNLELLPTTWDIQLNGNSLSGNEDENCELLNGYVGDAVTLTLSLSSGFVHSLKGKFFVDVGVHGLKDFDMENVCVQTESESRKLTCDPKHSIKFSTVVLPLVEGKLDIHCRCVIECDGLKVSSKHISKFPSFTYDVKLSD